MKNSISIQIANKTIAIGTKLRNGGNRYFNVDNITETTVTLREYNVDGPTERVLNIEMNSFKGLYRMKNYAIVNYFQSIKTNRWMERKDVALNRSLGLERYMVKQTIDIFSRKS